MVDVFHDDPRGEVIFVTTGLENRNVKFVKLEFEFVDWSTYGRGVHTFTSPPLLITAVPTKITLKSSGFFSIG